jgi:hypothetical protein
MHPSDPQMIRFLLEGDSARGAAAVSVHLEQGCAECARRLREYEMLVQTMRSDRTPEPPAEWVERAVRIFSESDLKQRILAWCSGLREELARLVGDSAGGPELGWAGTRHVADARRVRFESDRIELDLQIEPIASGGALTGQLSRLDPEALPLARARILATGDDLAMVEAETDELGEFAVEIGNVKGIVLRVVDESRLTVFAIPDVDPAP